MRSRAPTIVAPVRLLAVAAGLWLAAVGLAAEPPARAVLHLANGSKVAGEVFASDDPGVLRWQSPVFTGPLAFPIGGVRAVHYEVPTAQPRPKDEYGVELLNDDVLYGDILRLTDEEIELNSAMLGRLVVRRDQVCRIFRLEEAAAVYIGPNGLAGWKDPTVPTQWREEGGQIVTDQPAATVFADLNIPDKAVFDIELSWRQKPDFTLALGVAESDHAVRHAFRFEVWDGKLVVVGESVRDADAAILEPAGKIGDHIRVLAYVDRTKGRLFLVSRTGKLMATLSVAPDKPRPQAQMKPGLNLRIVPGAANFIEKPSQLTGLRLTNYKGDVRLETLRVSRWNGVPPQDVRDDQSRLHRADGSIVYGRLAAYDPEARRFTIHGTDGDTVVPHDVVGDIFVSQAKGKRPAAVSPTLRVVYRDGSRFSGTIKRIEADHVTLACVGLPEPLRLPLAGARSLVALQGAAVPEAVAADTRPGRLEADGVSLKGRLVDAGAGTGNPLVWQPDLALDPCSLVPGITGHIVYRDPPPPAPKPHPVNQRAIGLVIRGGEAAAPPAPTVPPPPSTGQRSMHLRTGDTVPCEVVRIDEKGVTIKASSTDTTFVPHDKIKSVELIPASNAQPVDEAKRDRLLTLPRSQRGAPPTHLICSTTGDFLRGRIIEMDDVRLKVEVRLDVKEVPRNRVAQIIWLHADELGDAKAAPPAPADAVRPTRVQTINSHGNRLTFVIRKSDGKTISGTSDVLGPCRADLADVDEVLLGAAIEESTAKLAYNDWKLHNAPDPKFVTADAGGGGGSAGTESPLVGQPAPEFHLDGLDGSKFKLADQNGRIVVLDFWATWCGPCMQSMPLVEDVTRDFVDRKVDLLAVNMEEQPDQVKAVVERHKFKARILMDRDGAVAAKYAVTAIPQTVIIDGEGKVTRLFVGGGKATADMLRKSLEELTAK